MIITGKQSVWNEYFYRIEEFNKKTAVMFDEYFGRNLYGSSLQSLFPNRNADCMNFKFGKTLVFLCFVLASAHDERKFISCI